CRSLLGMAYLGLAFCLSLGTLDSADSGKPAKPSARDITAVFTEIDAQLDKKLTEAKIPVSPLASDAEFLRRAYLDITGRIPPAAKATAFLDSKDSDKRRKLIDELLASPEYGKNFATVWTNLLLKRDEENVKLDLAPLNHWLAGSFNQNRGWNKMVS